MLDVLTTFRPRRRWLGLSAVIVGLTLLAGITAAAEGPPRPAPDASLYKAADGPLAVKTVEMLKLRDAKRGKDLQLRITWPDGDGPFPVIVWSHGATGTKDMYRPLALHWAGHGYVCIQPNHSDARSLTGKSGLGAGTFLDWENRPRDIAFTIDSLESIEKKIPALAGKLDRKTVGVGGHSFGAHTAQLVAGATTADFDGRMKSHADARPVAFLLLSPQGVGAHSAGLKENSWARVTRPFIVITGTKDFGRKGDDWKWRLHPYQHAPPANKFLLVIDEAWHGFGGAVGDGAEFRGRGPDNPDHRRYVKSASTAFWDAFLGKNPKALAFLRSDAMVLASGGKAKLSRRDADGSAKAGAASGPSAAGPARGAAGEAAPEPAVPRAKYASTHEDLTWRDAKRGRDVPVRVYAPKEAEGRLPAVVFSHGGGESRDAFGYLGEHLARRGYICVFLTHRGHDREAVRKQGMRGLGKLDDSRPRDMRFVLDRLLSGKPGSKLLAGRVDADAVAVAGQCAGTTTAITLVGGTVNLPDRPGVSFTDKRVKACVLLGPQMPAGDVMGRVLHHKSWATVGVPTLVITGTRDFNWIPAVRKDPKMLRAAYDGLPPGAKYLVEISGAEHNAFTGSVPYYPAGKRDARHHGWICQAVTGFLHAHLKGDRSALAWLERSELQKSTNGACRQEPGRSVSGEAEAGRDEQKQRPGEQPREHPRAAAAGTQVERMFRFCDRDHDGTLSRDELPERIRRGFQAVDSDRSGKISRREMTTALERFQGRGGAGGGTRRSPRPAGTEKQAATPAVPDKPDAAGKPGRAVPAVTAGVEVARLVKLRDQKRGKDLNVRVAWPGKGGRCPVIVFSHRVGGARHDYRPLVEHWVKGGYVVVQADHDDSRELGTPGRRLDWANRARDMSFLLDSLDEIEKRVPGLKGKMDTNRVGAGGHLIGAYAACTLAGQKNFSPGAPRDLKDGRVKATLLLSPQGRGQGLNEKSWVDVTGPLMVINGSKIPSRRTGNPSAWRKEPFTFSPAGEKYLVWIEGLEGTYAGLIEPGRGDDERAARWIRDATLAFWDAHLEGGSDWPKRYLTGGALGKESGGRVKVTAKPAEDSKP
jgi:predicted dienelactone hydrolase